MISYSYEVIQLGTERINGIDNVVKEVRFLHVACDGPDLIKKLYVIHIDYDENEREIYSQIPFYKKIFLKVVNFILGIFSDKKITQTKLLLKEQVEENSKVVIPYIEKCLGKDQIKHMENIIKKELKQNTREYTNIQ